MCVSVNGVLGVAKFGGRAACL